MINVVSSDVSRKSDELTIKSGVLSKTLMDNAARSIFNFIVSNNFQTKKIAIICGKGNNGGDGYCLACQMLSEGISHKVFGFAGHRSTDAQYYALEYEKMNGKINLLDDVENFNNFDVIVDAIFGTGLNKPLEGVYFDTIKKVNESKAYVISADISSGLNADNGLVEGIAVRADTTVTFQSAKLGHYLNDGRDYSGKLVVCDIGINLLEKTAEVIEQSDVKKFFEPMKINLHKGDLGKSAIIGGSKNFIGAPWLASMGTFALRVGSGLSYLGIPECIYDAVSDKVIDNIIYTFKSDDGVIEFDAEALEKFVNIDALAIGMGLGKCEDINKIVEFMLKKSSAKLLLDADALNLIDLNLLKNQRGRVVVTPHPKEFSRLIKVATCDILKNPIELSKSFAKQYNCVVLLKGATSIITDGKDVLLNISGTAGMAKGGSGDLLDGVIVGLMARGLNNFEACSVGAYIAGRSAEIAVLRGDLNNYSMLASDRVGFITCAVNELV
ncbi:MAG: NAD(P)H-hydrate dehydratase [Clostridia bacterium]